MDGDTKEDDPRTVRPINSAIPYVISKRIAPERFIRKFGQRTPADVAASMLSEGGGQVILNVWLHWEVPAMLCWMGVPITGWNSVSLDEETQATYKVREERERVGRRNGKMREAGLSPPGCGMLLMLEAAAELLVGGEEEGRREREGKKERRREAEREREKRFFHFSPFLFSPSSFLSLSPSLSPSSFLSLSLPPPQLSAIKSSDSHTNNAALHSPLQPVIVITPEVKGVRAKLFNAPRIDPVTFLPDFEPQSINKVFWESLTSWEDVARQQGNIERVIFPAGAAPQKEKEEKAGK